MTYADLTDFEARHGIQPEGEHERIEALLDDASAFIAQVASDGAAGWLEDGSEEPVPPIVVTIAVQVAYRAWRNPDAVAREEIGEISRTYRGGHESDALFLTVRERRMIRRAAGIARGPTSIGLVSPYSGSVGDGPPDFTWSDLHGGH